MKHFNYRLSDGDIETFLFTLSIMPSIKFDGVSPEQEQLNFESCVSAGEKLAARNANVLPDEIRVMAISLEIASLILSGEIDVDDDIKAECSQYRFSINKLLPIFSKIFE